MFFSLSSFSSSFSCHQLYPIFDSFSWCLCSFDSPRKSMSSKLARYPPYLLPPSHSRFVSRFESPANETKIANMPTETPNIPKSSLSVARYSFFLLLYGSRHVISPFISQVTNYQKNVNHVGVLPQVRSGGRNNLFRNNLLQGQGRGGTILSFSLPIDCPHSFLSISHPHISQRA